MSKAYRLCAIVELLVRDQLSVTAGLGEMAVCMVLRIVIMDTWWKAYIRVLK